MRPSYSFGSGPGSNKVVGKPGTGGVIQRRARPRPNHCALAARASCSSARCTVRGPVPSASARAELDHASPSARRASTAACSSSTGGASTMISRPPRGASGKPRFVALTSARDRSSTRSLPISTRNRARCDSSACLPRNTVATSTSLDTSAGQASPRARKSVNKTGRVASEMTCRRPERHCGTRRRRARPTARAPRPHREEGGVPGRPRSSAPPAGSAREMRSRLPPSAPGCLPRARRAQLDEAQSAPALSATAGWQSPQRPAHASPSTAVARASGRLRRAHARPLRASRSAADAEPRYCVHEPH